MFSLQAQHQSHTPALFSAHIVDLDGRGPKHTVDSFFLFGFKRKVSQCRRALCLIPAVLAALHGHVDVFLYTRSENRQPFYWLRLVTGKTLAVVWQHTHTHTHTHTHLQKHICTLTTPTH